MSKLRATKIVEARLIDPTEGDTQALRNLLKASAQARASLNIANSDEFMKQPDLMYIEAVLVSEGINDNDDAFVHDELTRSQATPILKPINLGHRDQDIVGVIYGVELRNFAGKRATADSNEPVEIVMKGVVWHYLPHLRETALSLAEKFVNSKAYVSMECWFEDYNYALYDRDGNLHDVINRCDDTAHLENYLRVCGGSGQYDGMRIGRALTGITFGGVGFVDIPANRRSDVLNVFVFDVSQSDDVTANMELATVATESNYLSPMEDSDMNQISNKAVASSDQDLGKVVESAVDTALSARDRAEAARKTQAELATAQATVKDATNKLQKVEAALASQVSVVDRLLNEARAAITSNFGGSVPQEIARIDSAISAGGSGDAVFQAKIAYIAQTKAELAAAGTDLASELEKIKAENEELRSQVREAVRTEEISAVFAELLDADELETMVKRGLAQSDDNYADWLEEKRLLAAKMSGYEKEGKNDPNEKKEMKEMKKKDGKAGVLTFNGDSQSVDDHGVALRSGMGRTPSSVPNPRSLASDLDAVFEPVNDVVNPEGATASADDADGEHVNVYSKVIASLLDNPAKSRGSKKEDN